MDKTERREWLIGKLKDVQAGKATWAPGEEKEIDLAAADLIDAQATRIAELERRLRA